MSVNRYFYEGDLKKGTTVSLNNVESHHLINVMKNRVGAVVECVNGRGELAECIVKALSRKEAQLEIRSLIYKPKIAPHISIVQGIPRAQRFNYIIEKGSELGADHFCFYPAKLSETKQLFPAQQSRMKQLAISAMKQCERLYLPEISLIDSLNVQALDADLILFGDLEKETPSLFHVLQARGDKPAKIAVIIGPEKGFADDEVKALRDQGALGISLHENVLRTETAPIAALAIIRNFYL